MSLTAPVQESIEGLRLSVVLIYILHLFSCALRVAADVVRCLKQPAIHGGDGGHERQGRLRSCTGVELWSPQLINGAVEEQCRQTLEAANPPRPGVMAARRKSKETKAGKTGCGAPATLVSSKSNGASGTAHIGRCPEPGLTYHRPRQPETEHRQDRLLRHT